MTKCTCSAVGQSHQPHYCHLAPPRALSENESVTLHLPGFDDGFGENVVWDDGLFSCINVTGALDGSDGISMVVHRQL